ncbi:MAG: bifunctional DNA primase/polymerase [Micromonosporaceae bacterium]|nr:bifunctional DNA primase/polymerase [Micromonosporaceae bacterium]
MPYADAAPLYWRAGWPSILPLPPGQKWPPPSGWTGKDAPDPDVAQHREWCGQRPHGNVALRLPAHVVGIDVDAYKVEGRESWQRLTAECGPLPDTWTSTSRVDGSGIRMYRVPIGVQWAERQAGPGIELVHHGHRYAVVWPSIHPEGSRYRWIAPDGHTAERVPTVAELPALPATWGRRLTVRPAPPPTGIVAGTGRSDGYPSAVLAGVCGDLATLGCGRNNALYMAALRLGRLVADGRLTEVEVTDALVAASDANGHSAKHGERRTLRTIESGLTAARTSPGRTGAR